MQELEIPLNSQADDAEIARSIDQAIDDTGLNVTLRASLGKFPGCVHWHVKRGHESGTLEITFWPQQHRAWFTIQSGRQAPWIEENLSLIVAAIQRRNDKAGDAD